MVIEAHKLQRDVFFIFIYSIYTYIFAFLLEIYVKPPFAELHPQQLPVCRAANLL